MSAAQHLCLTKEIIWALGQIISHAPARRLAQAGRGQPKDDLQGTVEGTDSRAGPAPARARLRQQCFHGGRSARMEQVKRRRFAGDCVGKRQPERKMRPVPGRPARELEVEVVNLLFRGRSHAGVAAQVFVQRGGPAALSAEDEKIRQPAQRRTGTPPEAHVAGPRRPVEPVTARRRMFFRPHRSGNLRKKRKL